jgi:hypothetical protein
MSRLERGSLKAAFTNFKKPDPDREGEIKLLGRTVETEQVAASQLPGSYQTATEQVAESTTSGLIPRPLLQREAVRQLSFRCPLSLAAELRRKAAFNQLEQQEILIEGLRRVLAELPSPPEDWQAR